MRGRAAYMKLKFNSKEALIEALESKRSICEQKDDEAIISHKLAEKQFLADFRDACRKAAKWTYEEAVEHSFDLGFEGWGKRNRPSCPVPLVEELDKALFMLNTTQQKAFTISDDYTYTLEGKIFKLLTVDAPEVKAVC